MSPRRSADRATFLGALVAQLSLLLSLGVAAGDVLSGPSPDTVIVVPDRTAYQPDSTGLVILQVTLINAGSTDATSSTCHFPAASGVAWRTEKLLNEAGRLIYDAGVNGLVILQVTLINAGSTDATSST